MDPYLLMWHGEPATAQSTHRLLTNQQELAQMFCVACLWLSINRIGVLDSENYRFIVLPTYEQGTLVDTWFFVMWKFTGGHL